MSFNGAGTYAAPASSWNPAVDNTTINSTDWNALLADLSTALSTCITKDGQQTVTANIPMGGFKFTGLGAGSASGNSIRYEQVNGVVTTKGDILVASGAGAFARLAVPANGFTIIGDSAATNGMGTAGLPLSVCEFRLTLTTGVPVTTTDVTGAGTLYCTPYKGNRIALYDGTATWNTRASAEFSLALTLTSGKPYDIFCYDNAGVPTLESLVWTNDTTRATALTTQNGVLVKTGATTRRYLGTIYASGSNTTEDSVAKRFVWNYYNRVLREMRVLEATNSWNYSTAAWQQANASAANQLDFVVGVSEDIVRASLNASVVSSGATVRQTFVSIGLDGTSGPATGSISGQAGADNTQIKDPGVAFYKSLPGVGRHYLTWLEYGAGADTQTWYGDNGGTLLQNGIMGEVLA